jgi:Transposase IS66 family
MDPAFSAFRITLVRLDLGTPLAETTKPTGKIMRQKQRRPFVGPELHVAFHAGIKNCVVALCQRRFHETSPLQLVPLVRKTLLFRRPDMIRILEAPD